MKFAVARGGSLAGREPPGLGGGGARAGRSTAHTVSGASAPARERCDSSSSGGTAGGGPPSTPPLPADSSGAGGGGGGSRCTGGSNCKGEE